jgi:uncharacterized LabA/DUF88 family protein
MDNEKRVAVYIDGSNFYHKLKDLKIANTTYFDYFGLCNFLARGRKLTSCRYYVGVVRAKEDDKKAQKMRQSQINLFNHLRDQGLYVYQGYLMKNDGKFHEKGVDVNIAVDLLVGAYENKYDTAILISSDSDLVPAVKKIKSLGKEIEHIGFSHSPCLALQKHATLSRLLISDDLENFMKKTLA